MLISRKSWLRFSARGLLLARARLAERALGIRFNLRGKQNITKQDEIGARIWITWPSALFGSVLPPTVIGLRSVICRTLQCRLVVIVGLGVHQQRGSYTQGLNFGLQPRHLKFFLPQNFINILHR